MAANAAYVLLETFAAIDLVIVKTCQVAAASTEKPSDMPMPAGHTLPATDLLAKTVEVRTQALSKTKTASAFAPDK